MADADRQPIRVAYERRNRDLDPQLVWHGKDEQDDRDLIVAAPRCCSPKRRSTPKSWWTT